jgi:iron-sulfur cluster insertion protein
LRLTVEGGGCAGLKYHLDLVEGQDDDDIVVEKIIDMADNQPAKVKLLVDPFSYMYVNQAKVDYVEDVNGKRFSIQNPNAQTTCGCGSSFVPKED